MSELLEKVMCDALLDVIKSLFIFEEAYLSLLPDYSDCSDCLSL